MVATIGPSNRAVSPQTGWAYVGQDRWARSLGRRPRPVGVPGRRRRGHLGGRRAGPGRSWSPRRRPRRRSAPAKKGDDAMGKDAMAGAAKAAAKAAGRRRPGRRGALVQARHRADPGRQLPGLPQRQRPGLRNGKLDMSTFEKLMAGGKRGKDIVARRPRFEPPRPDDQGGGDPQDAAEQRPAGVRRRGRREDRGLGQAGRPARRRDRRDRPDEQVRRHPRRPPQGRARQAHRPRSATSSPSRPAATAGRRPPRSSPR